MLEVLRLRLIYKALRLVAYKLRAIVAMNGRMAGAARCRLMAWP